MEKEIHPKLTQHQEVLCVDAVSGPASIVVFGASGDLAHRKLYPSLFELYSRDLICDRFYLIGCGRSEISDDQFRDQIRQTIVDGRGGIDSQRMDEFLKRFRYVVGQYDQADFYERIGSACMDWDKAWNVEEGVRLFYLSVPPSLYTAIAEQLHANHLACPAATGRLQQVRLVVEKPFGRDLHSAMELDRKLHLCFDESQIYRIDHYLGKETVQNIMVFRFANSLFEPIWNRNYIDHVQITIAEQLGVEHRAGYYDKTGALRDMFQNHMLQMLALIAMEAPTSFEADRVRDEKAKLLRSISPVQEKFIPRVFVRGQYAPGVIDGKPVPGYLQEEGVGPDSVTETFVAARLGIDNWRWKDVPFYLRTGKRLANKLTEIVITFKKIPHSMFHSVGLTDFPPNVLRFQIQPEEGAFLSLQAKRPGSKICISTLEMAVDYQRVFEVTMPEAYQRLLLDCLKGDQTLFARQDSIHIAWELLGPVLTHWEKNISDLVQYLSGANEISQADRLLVSPNHFWGRL